jgi:uracil-DNA glycosylase
VDRDEAKGPAARDAARAPWLDVLDEEMNKLDARDLLQFVDRERARHTVCLEPHDMFAAFQLTDYKKLKVIILGQDPLPPAQPANGPCFSVPNGVPKPKSLTNIHAAMRRDDMIPPEHGDLTASGNHRRGGAARLGAPTGPRRWAHG